MILKVEKQGMKNLQMNTDHLIDINSGEIVEFVDNEIEELQKNC